LLIKYGRRVGDKTRLHLLHINHGWRAKQSNADAAFVRSFGRTWKVPVTVVRIRPPGSKPGESWENDAREQRKQVFSRMSVRYKAVIMTAHQADDLAETLLWRLFTGTTSTHGGGIIGQHGYELRPFLRVRKRLLKEYLQEEGQGWREDSTNQDERFLRARMRKALMSDIERLFPRAVEHLVALALAAQRRAGRTEDESGEAMPEMLFSAAGVRARSAHWKVLSEKIARPQWFGELHFPGGWTLSRERPAPRKRRGAKTVGERWVLEKISH
jgi:tRNA(Ile)-lysidine synthase